MFLMFKCTECNTKYPDGPRKNPNSPFDEKMDTWCFTCNKETHMITVTD